MRLIKRRDEYVSDARDEGRSYHGNHAGWRAMSKRGTLRRLDEKPGFTLKSRRPRGVDS